MPYSSDSSSADARPLRQKGRSSRRQRQRRSPFVLLLLLLLWSLCMGLGLAQATEPRAGTPAQGSQVAEVGTVDPVPDRLQLGQSLYLENCATCHIGIPPAVYPTQTWADLIQDPQHYGGTLETLKDPNRLLVWNYLKTFSRPIAEGEETPYRFGQSRFFRSLHPKVKLPRPTTTESCITCHPGASQFNFRRLTAEWEKAP